MEIDINELLMSSSSSSSNEELDEIVNHREVRVRCPYRMIQRSKVEWNDDVDFRKYFRMNKNAFLRLLDLVRDDIDGNPDRLVYHFISLINFIIY